VMQAHALLLSGSLLRFRGRTLERRVHCRLGADTREPGTQRHTAVAWR
jgi:hypothetical protein